MTWSRQQQTMKRKFIRALVVVLAAFALVASSTLTISGTILGYTPGEMLQESPVTIPTPRDQQAGYSSLFAASSKRTCFPEFSLMTAFPPIGSSTYHAGSVDLNRRFARGLMLLANYT